jgi:peroxiredoxin
MSEPLAAGSKAPDFDLPSHLDERVSLSNVLCGGKSVVLFFYPLDWTPV